MQIASLTVAYLFIILMVSLIIKVLNCNVVPFIRLFLYSWCLLRLKKFLPSPVSQRHSPMFQKLFFLSLLYLGLPSTCSWTLFMVWDMGQDFLFLIWIYNWPHTIHWEDYFLAVLQFHLCCKSSDGISVSLLMASPFVIFVRIPCYFNCSKNWDI